VSVGGLRLVVVTHLRRETSRADADVSGITPCELPALPAATAEYAPDPSFVAADSR
jgi:hypothetical protein